MQTMRQIFIARISRTIVKEDTRYILSWTFMISRYEEKGNTFFLNCFSLLKFTQRVDQNINTLIPEFVSPAVYQQNAIFWNFISKNGFSNVQEFFPGY